jgi:hypothetical protein
MTARTVTVGTTTYLFCDMAPNFPGCHSQSRGVQSAMTSFLEDPNALSGVSLHEHRHRLLIIIDNRNVREHAVGLRANIYVSNIEDWPPGTEHDAPDDIRMYKEQCNRLL